MRGDSSRSDLVEFRAYSRGVYSGKRLTEMAIFTSPDRDMVARLLSDYNGSYFERNGFTSHGIARDQDHQRNPAFQSRYRFGNALCDI